MNYSLLCFFHELKGKDMPCSLPNSRIYIFSPPTHSEYCKLSPASCHFILSAEHPRKSFMKHEHYCEESWVTAHVAGTEPYPYRVYAGLVDTNFDMSNSLVGVDTATKPCWNGICTEFLRKWFKLWEGKKAREGSVFHYSPAQLYLSWYMGNFLKIVSRILKDFMMILSKYRLQNEVQYLHYGLLLCQLMSCSL